MNDSNMYLLCRKAVFHQRAQPIVSKPPSMIHRICNDRVLGRGEKHQTLRADVSAAKSHEGVIWMFINTTEDLVPDEVDEVIDIGVEENLAQAVGLVARVVKGVAKILSLELLETRNHRGAACDGYVPVVKESIEEKKLNRRGILPYQK